MRASQAGYLPSQHHESDAVLASSTLAPIYRYGYFVHQNPTAKPNRECGYYLIISPSPRINHIVRRNLGSPWFGPVVVVVVVVVVLSL